MKKTRSLFNVIFGVVLSIAFVFTLVSCTTEKSDDPYKSAEDLGITETKDSYQLQEIALSGMYKTEFKQGENFSYDGMIVTATYIDRSTKDNKVVNEILSSDKYHVDSKDYLAKQVGTYNITVSYTHKEVTKSAMYSVNVSARDVVLGGIVAKLATEKNDKYTLSADVTSVTISKDILVVYEVDAEGKVKETPMSEELYTAQLYLGSKKIEGNTATENGVYSFTVFLNSDNSIQDFINVYVSNPVSSIKLIDDDDNLFEQEASTTDEISKTWSFEVTYVTGVTKVVSAEDSGLHIDINTSVAGNDKKATVTFKEADAAYGNEHTVTCEVKYTIKAKKVEGEVTYTVNYTAKLETGTTGKFETTYGEDAGEDAAQNVIISDRAATFKNTNKSTADKSVTLSDCAEIKKDKEITIVIGENAKNVTITAYVSHTTSSNARTPFIGKQKDGTDALASITIGGEGNVPTSDLYALSVSNVDSGTYYVSSFSDANGKGVTIHCYQVVVTYTIVASADEPVNYEPVIIDFSSLVVGDYTADNKDAMGTISLKEDGIVSGIEFILGNTVKVKNSDKTINHAGHDYSVTKFYSTQGSAKANTRSIHLKLKDASLKYKVTVYAESGKEEDRRVAYSFDNFASKQTCNVLVQNSIVASEFTFTGDSVWFGSSNSSINIYLIVVEVVTE